MAKRSIEASTAGIQKAKQAFKRTGWTQQDLASEVGLETRQSVWKFFSGRPIERSIFIDICYKLNLDWQEIAGLTPQTEEPEKQPESKQSANVDEVVQQVRSRLYEPIQAQCGTLQLLDNAQPIALDDVYISVNILEQLSRQQWLDVSDLQSKSATPSPTGRIVRAIAHPDIPALTAVAHHSKLMVLGKPGAGKTTFLQSLALQCIRGTLQPQRIPIFLRLREVALEARESGDFSLFNYISRKVYTFGISPQQVETLLQHGRILLLLDGLDEIGDSDRQELDKQIGNFTETYYQNHFIITCRLAAQQYRFSGFTHVEMADFNSEQIEAFANKWFVAAGKNPQQGLEKATQFIDKLKLPENQPIRDLVISPILLTLTASVFETKADFPNKRSKLYEAGLDILLVRWDEARGIQRDEVYRSLSLPRKIEMLSQIAATKFKQGNYFFEQREIEQDIADYLATLPGSKSAPETLRSNSEAVLKAIEVQHGLLVERARGIYSFSHLTFQEYFTARFIVSAPDDSVLREELQQLAVQVREPQWREVFLLTTELLRNADPLLQVMKQQIDALAIADEKLQQFLISLDKKCRTIEAPYTPAAIRAFYLTLFFDRDLGLALELDPSMARNVTGDLALDLELARAFSLVQKLTEQPDIKQILGLGFALDLDRVLLDRPELRQALQKLKDQLPDTAIGKERLIQWWQTNGIAWAEQLRALLIQHRHMAHDWQFSALQLKQLTQYYRANKLLVDCLHPECRCSENLRSHLEASLLLPVPQRECNPIESAYPPAVNAGQVSPEIWPVMQPIH